MHEREMILITFSRMQAYAVRQWITLPPPEHEHMAAERVLLRRLLGLGRQRGKALAHVGHPGRPVAR